MDTTRINKHQLLEIVRDNMAKHVAEYIEATVGFNEQFWERVASLSKLKDEKEARDRAGAIYSMQKPVSHEADYKRVIRMLELSVDDVIEIGEHEFMQYVQDEWAWKQQFAATTSLYNAKKF